MERIDTVIKATLVSLVRIGRRRQLPGQAMSDQRHRIMRVNLPGPCRLAVLADCNGHVPYQRGRQKSREA